MIDPVGRAKLDQRNQMQTMTRAVSEAVAQAMPRSVPQTIQVKAPLELTQKIDKLASAIEEKHALNQKPVTPAEMLANELKSLQRVIGQGSLIDSLSTLSTNLNSLEFNVDSLNELRSLVADLSQKVKVLTELEAKIPSEIKVQLKEELTGMAVTGQVDIGSVKALPPVRVSNLDELAIFIQRIVNEINAGNTATAATIKSSKVDMPKSFTVSNEVKIKEWADLIDGIEELKKGFNLLINKEEAVVGFPDRSIPVEIQNWMIPQPVTNVSLNPNRGTVTASAVTVTASLTPLPGTALADRRSMTIFNNSTSTTIYVGGSNVTSATGIPVPPQSYGPSLDAGPRNIVYAVTVSGSANVRVLEMNDLVAGGDN